MPPISQILFFILNCLGTLLMTFIGLYEFPVFYVEMNILFGLLIVPVGAFLSSLILTGVMKWLRFKTTGVMIAATIIISSIIPSGCYMVSLNSFTIQQYFSHLYYSRSDYEEAVSKKLTYHHVNSNAEDSLRKKLPTNYVVTNAITDNKDTDRVIFEAMAPSILYGNVLYDGVYRVKEDQITNFVSADDIWKELLSREHLRITASFDRVFTQQNFNNREIIFSSKDLNNAFDVIWTVRQDKIQIQDVYPRH